ncbi:MAG: AAA family ATPase [Elusimicrobiota bacterium]
MSKQAKQPKEASVKENIGNRVVIEEVVIKNFAIIEDAELTPDEGINVFTGETGAGKSILAEALAYVFGCTSVNAEALRVGAKQLQVAVRVRLAGRTKYAEALLERLGLAPATDGCILLRRSFDAASGKSRAFVNDMAVTLAGLREISAELIEIHYQNSQLDLVDADFAREYLDAWSGSAQMAASMRECHERYRAAKRDVEEHARHVAEHAAKADFLRFQYEEIAALGLNERVIRELSEDLSLWAAKDKAVRELDAVRAALCDEDAGAIGRIETAQESLRRLGTLLKEHAQVGEIVVNVGSALTLLQDAAGGIASVSNRFDHDPARLDELLSLKARIDRLMQRHHCADVKELDRVCARLAGELAMLDNAGLDSAELSRRADAALDEAKRQAAVLSKRRVAAAKELTKVTTAQLKDLGLKDAQIGFQVTTSPQLESWGCDMVSLLFAPNPGEGFKELSAIASGGEISRVMLVLKALLADSRQSGHCVVLFFDEIEQGLSPAVTAKVGGKFEELSRAHQIFAITHSPVLASFAQEHYLVRKRVESGRTFAEVLRLSADGERRGEALRLIGASDPKARQALEPYLKSFNN